MAVAWLFGHGAGTRKSRVSSGGRATCALTQCRSDARIMRPCDGGGASLIVAGDQHDQRCDGRSEAHARCGRASVRLVSSRFSHLTCMPVAPRFGLLTATHRLRSHPAPFSRSTTPTPTLQRINACYVVQCVSMVLGCLGSSAMLSSMPPALGVALDSTLLLRSYNWCTSRVESRSVRQRVVVVVAGARPLVGPPAPLVVSGTRRGPRPPAKARSVGGANAASESEPATRRAAEPSWTTWPARPTRPSRSVASVTSVTSVAAVRPAHRATGSSWATATAVAAQRERRRGREAAAHSLRGGGRVRWCAWERVRRRGAVRRRAGMHLPPLGMVRSRRRARLAPGRRPAGRLRRRHRHVVVATRHLVAGLDDGDTPDLGREGVDREPRVLERLDRRRAARGVELQQLAHKVGAHSVHPDVSWPHFLKTHCHWRAHCSRGGPCGVLSHA
jgi:hypothetical protein